MRQLPLHRTVNHTPTHEPPPARAPFSPPPRLQDCYGVPQSAVLGPGGRVYNAGVVGGKRGAFEALAGEIVRQFRGILDDEGRAVWNCDMAALHYTLTAPRCTAAGVRWGWVGAGAEEQQPARHCSQVSSCRHACGLPADTGLTHTPTAFGTTRV